MNTVSMLIAAGVAGGAGEAGQCVFDVSLRDAFVVGRPDRPGGRQLTGDAFVFRRDGVNGALLAGFAPETGPSFWGEPSQPFNVPIAGGVFSPDPQVNEITFRDREPGFSGIMLHPGYGGISLHAVFTAQSAISIASLELSTEVLGDVSDGVSVTVTMVSAGGTQTTLIGPLTSLWGQGPLHSPLLPSVPIQMAAGDRLVVTTSNNGQPFEDWENVELVMQLTQSPPVVLAQPRRVSACPGGSATLSVVAAGAEGYQWERGTAPIEGATGATLTLSGLDDQDGAQYRCIVRNACGETVSAFGSVLVRTADIGGAGGLEPGDGVLDNNDFIVFITRFFAGDGRGDYGAAGGLPGPDDAFDNNDFIAFINLFFNGCGG